MRYIFRAFRPSLTRGQIDQYTENRLMRQKVLDNTDQQFWFVIHKAALRSLENIDGDNSVLEDQARHLMEAIDRPNVEVQVAPFRHGYYPGQEETYLTFGFDTNPSVQVTYVEKYDGGDILHGGRNLDRFDTFWDHQRVHALGRSRPARSCVSWRGRRDGTHCTHRKGTPPMSTWVWRKSSFSNGGNNACVEVGFSDEVTALRDSKNPDGGALTLFPTAWQSLRSTLTR